MKKQTKVWLMLSVALSLMALGSACGNKSGDTNAPDNSSTTASKTYSGAKGTVAGVIAYSGTPPAAKKIDTSADPV